MLIVSKLRFVSSVKHGNKYRILNILKLSFILHSNKYCALNIYKYWHVINIGIVCIFASSNVLCTRKNPQSGNN